MKKLIITIGLAVACLTTSVKAQTNSNTDVIAQVGSGIWNSGILNATNYAIEPYATYAPQAPKGSKIGGGLFVAYNVNDYVGVGLGMDYLGHFSLISANCQLKYAIHPIAAAPNFALVPFALGGVGNGFGNGGAVVVTDAGAYIQFGHLLGGSFNLGGAYGRWDNAGAFSGVRYHIFAGWSKGF